MRLKPKFKKVKGFEFKSYITQSDPAPAQQIEVLYFEDAYQNSFIPQTEYFARRVEELPLSISYFVENNSCWQVKDGGETIRIIVFGRRSYEKTAKLIALLLKKYSLSFDNIILGFEDKTFIKELIKATQ